MALNLRNARVLLAAQQHVHPHPSLGGCEERIPARNVACMDIASMIMGGSIASVAWIALTPWAKLKRLKQLEADDDGA